MPMNYLDDLERLIGTGGEQFVCPGGTTNEWYFAKTSAELSTQAQRSADALRFPTHIYRLVGRTETTAGTPFLVVRRILAAGPDRKPNLHWLLVDTLEAAEMLRDVSQGPTPLFGAVVEQSFEPRQNRNAPR